MWTSRARSVSQVEAADSVLALGIDGLYFHRGGLIGIQNGVTPHRVARFTLGPSGDRVIRAEVLERAHPRYDEPTLGVLVDGELYYIANAQWERFGEDGRIAESRFAREGRWCCDCGFDTSPGRN